MYIALRYDLSFRGHLHTINNSIKKIFCSQFNHTPKRKSKYGPFHNMNTNC